MHAVSCTTFSTFARGAKRGSDIAYAFCVTSTLSVLQVEKVAGLCSRKMAEIRASDDWRDIGRAELTPAHRLFDRVENALHGHTLGQFRNSI